MIQAQSHKEYAQRVRTPGVDLADQIATLRTSLRSLLAEARPFARPDLIVAAEHALEISGGV